VSVWSLKPDGTDERKEPSITEFDGLPDVSLDGTLLAHEGGSLDASLEGLYVRPLGSATATRLTTDPLEYYDSNPDIAPDNSRIVFQRFYNNSARVEIWTINTDGTGLRRLLSGGRRWGDPHYSPDGSKILVQLGYERANQGNNTNEYVMNSDGTNLRPITSMPMGSFVFGGDWSPDGQHIAYMRFLRGEDHIQVRSMDANGNDEGLIADCDPVAFCHNARWSAYEGPLRAASEARASRSAQHAARRHRLSHRAAARRMARIVRRALSR
jgi:Tol biopolymer transport system component